MHPDFLSWFYTWGLKVGRVAGIVVRIHWTLLVLWLLDFHRIFNWDISRGFAFALFATTVVGVFSTIFLHELGHCFAARRMGGTAESVLLWPLGGLAMVSVGDHWRPNLVVAAAGPLVNVVIGIVAWVVFAFLDPPESGMAIYWYDTARYFLVDFNLILLVFNLLPLWPLDGGRIFHSLVWRHHERRGGYGAGPWYRASMLTVYVSRAVLIVLAIWALFGGESLVGGFGLLFLVWVWIGTEGLRARAQSGAGPETTYGYDFSQGYTSIDRGYADAEARSGRRRAKKPGLAARLRSWWKDPKVLTIEEARRVDELLDRIAREGQDSLSRAEQRFLKRMSRRRFPRR